MINRIQDPEAINWTNTTGVAISSGAVVPLTDRIGIASRDIAIAATESLRMDGVFEVAKNVAEAFTPGQQVYWDPVADNLDSDPTDNIPAGYITEVAAQAATVARVSINR